MEPVEGVSAVAGSESRMLDARLEAEAAMLRRLLASEAAAALQLIATLAPVQVPPPVSPGRGGVLDTYVR